GAAVDLRAAVAAFADGDLALVGGVHRIAVGVVERAAADDLVRRRLLAVAGAVTPGLLHLGDEDGGGVRAGRRQGDRAVDVVPPPAGVGGVDATDRGAGRGGADQEIQALGRLRVLRTVEQHLQVELLLHTLAEDVEVLGEQGVDLDLLGVRRDGVAVVGQDDAVGGQLVLVEHEAVVEVEPRELGQAHRVTTVVVDLVVAVVVLVVRVVADTNLLVEVLVAADGFLLVGDEPLQERLFVPDLVDRVVAAVDFELSVRTCGELRRGHGHVGDLAKEVGGFTTRREDTTPRIPCCWARLQRCCLAVVAGEEATGATGPLLLPCGDRGRVAAFDLPGTIQTFSRLSIPRHRPASRASCTPWSNAATGSTGRLGWMAPPPAAPVVADDTRTGCLP